MIICVTGSRYWNNKAVIEEALNDVDSIHYNGENGLTLVHGGAKGADHIASVIAQEFKWDVIEVKADWSQGKKAGMIRNRKMLDEYKPDLVIAFPEPNSIGTIGCINEAIKRQIPVEIYYNKAL